MMTGLLESRLRWKKLRRIVLTATLAFVGGTVAVYLLSGSTVLFGADGMVTRERIAIAAPWPDARVRAVFVRPGDKVTAGQKIAVVESTSILRSLSDLAAEKARISGRIADLDARKSVVDALLPLAEANNKQAKVFLDQLRKASADGMAVNKSLQEIMASSLLASERLLSMQAERISIDPQAEVNKKAMDQVSAAYDDLERSYDHGTLYAPASGYIGSQVAMVGEVLSPGKDEIANLFTGPNFVLAYIPESYWFDVEPGQRVAVQLRGQTLVGSIEAVLPVTDALPPEFQLPNKVRGRGQLVRVILPNNDDLVVGQKTLVTSCYVSNCGLSFSNTVKMAARTFVGL